jgi:DNA-binding response OmpR family regulator
MLRDGDQPLLGCRVLVVEDEYFLADDLRSELEAIGANVIGPVGDLGDARACVERDGFDVAVIDINLRGEAAYALADKLARQRIPFLFTAAYWTERVRLTQHWSDRLDSLRDEASAVSLRRSAA